jgi:guanylate kinase
MNKLLVFTAPSGAGKTTIVKHLLKKYDQLAFSVSATTRPMRTGEVDGKDYYFLSHDTFRALIEEGAFLEWEEVYTGRFYGTLRKEVERLWNEGKCVVFDIDVKGATSIKSVSPKETLVIFVKPPSFQALVSRLEMRRTEDAESFAMRIQKAKEELLFEHSFDAILVNDELTTTLSVAERLVEQFLAKKR